MTTTRTIYRETPRQDLAITDAAVAFQSLLAAALGTGVAAPVVIKLAGAQPPVTLIALAAGCAVGGGVMVWRLRQQDKLRMDVYEETTESEPEPGVIGEVWNQTKDGQLRRANPRLHQSVLTRLGVVVHGNIRAGKRNARIVSRDDVDTAMTLAGRTWAHDDWPGLRQEFERAGWVDKYGKVTSAFWAAVGLSPSPPPSTSVTNEPPRDGAGG